MTARQGPGSSAIVGHPCERSTYTDWTFPSAREGRLFGHMCWYADGDMVRKAYTLRAEDDDFGQAGTLVRDVLDDAARARLVSNIVGHLKDGVSEPVLARTLEYWHKVDKDLGERIAAGMKEG